MNSRMQSISFVIFIFCIVLLPEHQEYLLYLFFLDKISKVLSEFFNSLPFSSDWPFPIIEENIQVFLLYCLISIIFVLCSALYLTFQDLYFSIMDWKNGTQKYVDNRIVMLRDACENGDTLPVLLLNSIENNINQVDKFGQTLLFTASFKNNIEIVSLLLNHGANVNQANNYGQTPLYVACLNGDVKVVSLLLKHGANVNQANNNGETPLHIASYLVHIEIVSLLLNHGANVNQATNEDGITALHYVCDQGNMKLATLLLNHGANINRIDEKSPFYRQIVFLLLKRRGKIIFLE